MVNKTVLKWLGSLIPLIFLDKHHNHPVYCGYTIVSFNPHPSGHIAADEADGFMLLVDFTLVAEQHACLKWPGFPHMLQVLL